MDYTLKVVDEHLIPALKKLSTENLVIWVVGTSERKKIKLSIEEVTLECWAINPEKHSMRGYAQYPDSFVIVKRIWDMKGRKGLLEGTAASSFKLTLASWEKFKEIERDIQKGTVREIKTKTAADRSINSLDEAPYKRLVRTTAYTKYKDQALDQIVESDFLYFYGVNWHGKKTFTEGKIKNIDLVVEKFSLKDPALKEVRDFLNQKFETTRKTLTQ